VSRPAVRVLFPCTGLGREQRGFEAFTRECAAAMRGTPGLEIEVLGGGGPDARPGERAVRNLPRAGRAARALGTLVRRDPYFVEQWSFFAGMLPRLAAGGFLAAFNDKGSYSCLTRACPVHVVTNPDLPLLGAARYALHAADVR